MAELTYNGLGSTTIDCMNSINDIKWMNLTQKPIAIMYHMMYYFLHTNGSIEENVVCVCRDQPELNEMADLLTPTLNSAFALKYKRVNLNASRSELVNNYFDGKIQFITAENQASGYNWYSDKSRIFFTSSIQGSTHPRFRNMIEQIHSALIGSNYEDHIIGLPEEWKL